jgi:hypothetical protein
MNGQNKLEYYIAISWKQLPGTKTLAYWALSNMKKIKYCECDPIGHSISFSSKPLRSLDLDNSVLYWKPGFSELEYLASGL